MSAYFDLLGTELQRAAERPLRRSHDCGLGGRAPDSASGGARRRMRRLSAQPDWTLADRRGSRGRRRGRLGGRRGDPAVRRVTPPRRRGAGSGAAISRAEFVGRRARAAPSRGAALQRAGVPRPRGRGRRLVAPPRGSRSPARQRRFPVARARAPPAPPDRSRSSSGGEPLNNVLGYLPGARPPATKPGAPSRARPTQALLQTLQDDVFLNWFVVSDRVAAIQDQRDNVRSPP